MVMLPTDKDVINFALAGKVIGARYTRSVIFTRFEKNFDLDTLELTKEDDESHSDFRERTLATIQVEYATRQALGTRLVSFSQWGSRAEKAQAVCIRALTSVITSKPSFTNCTEEC